MNTSETGGNPPFSINIHKFQDALRAASPMKMTGKVTQIIGLVIESQGPTVTVGELCYVSSHFSGMPPVPAEVVGFREGSVLLMPVGEMQGIGPGCEVVATGRRLRVKVGMELLGRRIHDNLYVGVRAIDGLITLGDGQRIGIMAGSGVGKSTLLSMIARNTEADISVITLVGERGREVRDFIERDLGEEGLKRSVVVVATSDQPALVRIKGAMTGTAIAEYFRDQGRRVVLMMASVTRFAMAQREVGLTIGEPPATRGYTPSVFAMLPRLLERAGTSEKGSITGIYTVLVDGDDMNEPIADAVRSILDGHIVLSRRIAAQNHFPAIDVLSSVSRVMYEVVEKRHLEAAQEVRQLMAVYQEAEDLIHIGAYVKGSSPKIDAAIQKIDGINEFLCQGIYEVTSYEETEQRLIGLTGKEQPAAEEAS